MEIATSLRRPSRPPSSATFGDHPGLPDVIPQPANVANPSSSDAPTADPNLICLRPTREIILSPRPDRLLERISQVRCQILSSVYLKDRFEKVPGHDHWSLAIRLLTHGILSHFFTQELQSYNFMLNGEISSPGRFWWIFFFHQVSVKLILTKLDSILIDTSRGLTPVERVALACGKCLSVDIALSLDLTTISYRDHLPSSLKLKVPVRAHSGVNPHASGPTASQPPTGETLGGTKTTINKAAK